MAAQLFEFTEKNFSSPISDAAQVQLRSEFILKHVHAHPESYALLQEALTEGPIKVEFLEESKIGALGCWRSISRKLCLSEKMNLSAELLYYFIFELCNATNKKYKRISHLKPGSEFRQFIECYPTDQNYAEAKEDAEYDTHVRSIKIFAAAVKNSAWPNFNFGIPKTVSREEWLRTAKIPDSSHEGISHFDTYRRNYNRDCLLGLNSDIEILSEVNKELLLEIRDYESLIRRAKDSKLSIAPNPEDQDSVVIIEREQQIRIQKLFEASLKNTEAARKTNLQEIEFLKTQLPIYQSALDAFDKIASEWRIRLGLEKEAADAARCDLLWLQDLDAKPENLRTREDMAKIAEISERIQKRKLMTSAI